MQNLQSSLNKMGKTVTQIIHFKNYETRTFEGILTEEIYQNNGITYLPIIDGRTLEIIADNVEMIRVRQEGQKPKFGEESITKIIHCKSGNKLTADVLIGTEKIGEFLKMDLKSGEYLLVNLKNILFFETFPRNELFTGIILEDNLENQEKEIEIFKKVFKQMQIGFQKTTNICKFLDSLNQKERDRLTDLAQRINL